MPPGNFLGLRVAVHSEVGHIACDQAGARPLAGGILVLHAQFLVEVAGDLFIDKGGLIIPVPSREAITVNIEAIGADCDHAVAQSQLIRPHHTPTHGRVGHREIGGGQGVADQVLYTGHGHRATGARGQAGDGENDARRSSEELDPGDRARRYGVVSLVASGHKVQRFIEGHADVQGATGFTGDGTG